MLLVLGKYMIMGYLDRSSRETSEHDFFYILCWSFAHLIRMYSPNFGGVLDGVLQPPTRGKGV